MKPAIKRCSLGLACALALAAPAAALAGGTPSIKAAVALHEFDTLVVFVEGMLDHASSYSARLGTVDGWIDLADLCASEVTSNSLVELQCAFPGGLPAAGDYVLEIGTVAGLDRAYFPFAIGEAGAPGVPGEQGPVGVVGPMGATGEIGAPGAQGLPGVPGIAGNPGPVGPQGEVGAQGAVGEKGPVGQAGAIGPQGAVGAMGAIGPVGAAGAPGAVGPQGVVGAQGPVGARGPVGLPGARGAAGDMGPQGPVGLQGVVGAVGMAGLPGATGPEGAVGAAGPAGEPGAPGVPGAAGAMGPVGAMGAQGPQGVAGNTGFNARLPLVESVPVPAGGTCSFGGQRLVAGLDVNGDGLLDAGEVGSSAYLCNIPQWTSAREFDNCNASGRLGPVQAACEASYSGNALEGEVTVADGIQYWTVPATGVYRITVAGAQGGYLGSVATHGGLGARVSGDVLLQVGDVLEILVGHAGELGSVREAGGGGGSFVVRDGEPLLVAGGGGSAGGCAAVNNAFASGLHGQASAGGSAGKGENGSTSGGTGGSDGSGGGAVTAHFPGGGGGGFEGNGGYGQRTSWACYSIGSGHSGLDANPLRTAGGRSFLEGGIGGRGCYEPVRGQGGFGGGGGGGGCGGAGGGGFSGGGGGRTDYAGGGGGGSFNSGANPVNETGVNAGHGRVTIDIVL